MEDNVMDIDTGASLLATTIILGQPFYANSPNAIEAEATRRLYNNESSNSNALEGQDQETLEFSSQDALINLLDGLNEDQIRVVLGIEQSDGLIAAQTVTDTALDPLLETDSTSDTVLPDFSFESLQFLESLGGVVDTLG